MTDAHKHYVGKVAQKAVIEKDGKYLLVRGTHDKAWDLPGGRLHANEAPLEGLAREVEEELGVSVDIDGPFYVDRAIDVVDKEERYFVCFRARLTDPAAPLKLQEEEINETRWATPAEIEMLEIYDPCRAALRAALR